MIVDQWYEIRVEVTDFNLCKSYHIYTLSKINNDSWLLATFLEDVEAY